MMQSHTVTESESELKGCGSDHNDIDEVQCVVYVFSIYYNKAGLCSVPMANGNVSLQGINDY